MKIIYLPQLWLRHVVVEQSDFSPALNRSKWDTFMDENLVLSKEIYFFS